MVVKIIQSKIDNPKLRFRKKWIRFSTVEGEIIYIWNNDIRCFRKKGKHTVIDFCPRLGYIPSQGESREFVVKESIDYIFESMCMAAEAHREDGE